MNKCQVTFSGKERRGFGPTPIVRCDKPAVVRSTEGIFSKGRFWLCAQHAPLKLLREEKKP